MIGYTFDSSKMGELQQHRMTLEEWQRHTDCFIGDTESGAKWTPANVSAGKWELFHLEDYIVSSCSVGVYWLVPR